MDAGALAPVPSRLMVWGRAVVLGAAVLGTGVASHVAGGGYLPGAWALVALFALTAWVASRLLTVRATPLGLVALVVAGQTAVHAALSVFAGHRGAPGLTAAPASTGMSTGLPTSTPISDVPRTGALHDLYAASLAGSAHDAAIGSHSSGLGGGWVSHQLDHLVAQGPAMVLAHLGGAVALALFLAVGEGALWRLLLVVAARRHVQLSTWRLVLAAAAVRRGLQAAPDRIGRPALPQRPSQRLCFRVPRYRGPPALLAA